MTNGQRKTVSPRIARMLRELEGPPKAIPHRVVRDNRRPEALTVASPRGLVRTA
jgi:hypothetical protein